MKFGVFAIAIIAGLHRDHPWWLFFHWRCGRGHEIIWSLRRLTSRGGTAVETVKACYHQNEDHYPDEDEEEDVVLIDSWNIQVKSLL